MTVAAIDFNVPALAHDAMMLERFGSKVSVRGRLERRIVWNLCLHLKRAGFKVISIHDGEKVVKCADAKAAMEEIFNLDEAWLHVRKPKFKVHTIFLVLGNGIDMICDHNYTDGDPDGFLRAMDEFDVEACA